MPKTEKSSTLFNRWTSKGPKTSTELLQRKPSVLHLETFLLMLWDGASPLSAYHSQTPPWSINQSLDLNPCTWYPVMCWLAGSKETSRHFHRIILRCMNLQMLPDEISWSYQPKKKRFYLDIYNFCLEHKLLSRPWKNLWFSIISLSDGDHVT